MSVANDSSADPEQAVSRKYLVVLGISALILAGYLVNSFMGGPVSPSTLAARALSAANATERKRAAEELASIVDRVAALPNLRRVAKESQDPEVLAITLSRLLVLRDTESLPLCFSGLKNSSKEVRERVYFSMQGYYGGSLPEGIEYSAEAPAEGLAEVVTKLNEFYSRPSAMMMSGSSSTPSPATPVVAVAKKVETPNPIVAVKKEETPNSTMSAKKEETPNPTAATLAPAPSVAPSPSMAPSYVSVAPTENPTVNFLAWMFRGLAAMVLLAEIGGAIGLVVGERTVKSSKGVHPHRQPPSLSEEVAVVLAEALAKNSAALWLKIAILFAGVICAVALLMAAELSLLAVHR